MTQSTPLAPSRESILLDDRIRGVPPGTSSFDSRDVGSHAWHPAQGRMSLPVLTLDKSAFCGNRDLLMRFAREQGVQIAPHAKTPMSPDLAHALIDAGAWGTTVADIRQAAVMLKSGLNRLILANEVGGSGGAGRLAALVAAWPKAELYVFCDSVALAQALADAWTRDATLAPLRVLIETGAARAGARTLADCDAILDIITATAGRLVPAGVATYEGSAGQPTPEQTRTVIGDLLKLTGEVLSHVRAKVGPSVPLLLTGGGSQFFDWVVASLGPIARADGATTLVLRSGALFFHDHGGYSRAVQSLDQRQGFVLGGAVKQASALFKPTLRIWAEVLSRPEPMLAICGMGKRDVSLDQDLPYPLALYRNGVKLPLSLDGATVTALNDQHAFVALDGDTDVKVGDVVEFGISHPCTCLDRYRVIFGVDKEGVVQHAFPTHFG